MANNHATLDALFSDIASEIRSKKGSSESIVADQFPDKIASIQASDLVSGTKNITSNGTYDVTSYASANVAAEPVLQEKSVTPSTAAQEVTPDSGYDGLSKVSVGAMPTATQATPSITVSSSGLITASATQSAGYVAAGTKSATKQMTTQAAKTITPGTADQTAVSADRYTTGAVTVQGDANLVAENVKKGVSIFGVSGSYEGSGSGSSFNVYETVVATFAVNYGGENGIAYYGKNGATFSGILEKGRYTFEILKYCGFAITGHNTGTVQYVSVSTGSVYGSDKQTNVDFVRKLFNIPTTISIKDYKMIVPVGNMNLSN